MRTEDVRLPNGYIIKGVPTDTSKDALKDTAIKNGWATAADFGAPVAEEYENTTVDNIQGAGQKILDGLFYGTGDEIQAAGRAAIDSVVRVFDEDLAMYGSAPEAYKEFLESGREVESNFQENNPLLSAGLEISAGLTTGLAVGRAVGLGATRTANAAKQGGAGLIEGALYGFGEGEGVEDRLEDAVGYGVLGGALGGTLGLVFRGAAEEVVPKKYRGKSTGQTQKDFSASNIGARRGAAEIGEGTQDSLITNSSETAVDTIASIGRRIRNWTDSNVNEVAGRQLTKAEGASKIELGALSQSLDTVGGAKGAFGIRKSGLNELHNWFEKTPAGQRAKKFIMDANQRTELGVALPPSERKDMMEQANKVIRGQGSESVRKTWDALYDAMLGIKERDPGQIPTADYFHMRSGSNTGDRVVTGNYLSPVQSFLKYAEDVVQANHIAREFNVDPLAVRNKFSAEDIRTTVDKMVKEGKSTKKIQKFIERAENGTGNTERVIGLVRDKYPDLVDAQRENLAEALDSVFVMGNKSPNEILTNLRSFTSASLIATFSNTLLNMAELGASAFKNSVGDTLAVLPRGVRSALSTNADRIVDDYDGWVRAADVGVTGQFLGEIKSEAKSSIGKMLENVYDGLFTITGGRSSTQLTQEVTINASLREAARAFKRKGVEGFKELRAARGLSDEELGRIGRALEAKNYKHPEVLKYGFAALAEVMPSAKVSMPKPYLKHPNGRVFYGLKSYMIQQMNNAYDDVLKEYASAYRYGLNTKEGLKHFSTATKNGMKFAVMVGGVNAVLDPGRKEVLYNEDTGSFGSAEEMAAEYANQITNIATGGLVDIKSYKYGAQPLRLLDAPAVGTVTDAGNAIFGSIKDADPDQMAKLLQSRILFGRQADELYRIATRGDRLIYEKEN